MEPACDFDVFELADNRRIVGPFDDDGAADRSTTENPDSGPCDLSLGYLEGRCLRIEVLARAKSGT